MNIRHVLVRRWIIPAIVFTTKSTKCHEGGFIRRFTQISADDFKLLSGRSTGKKTFAVLIFRSVIVAALIPSLRLRQKKLVLRSIPAFVCGGSDFPLRNRRGSDCAALSMRITDLWYNTTNRVGMAIRRRVVTKQHVSARAENLPEIGGVFYQLMP